MPAGSATFLSGPNESTSDLGLVDAARMVEAPVAVVRLPQRVPHGLRMRGLPNDSSGGLAPKRRRAREWPVRADLVMSTLDRTRREGAK
jgi:hypothetical protein